MRIRWHYLAFSRIVTEGCHRVCVAGPRLQVEEFKAVVESIARVLVEDMDLPPYERRFTPRNTRGIAGGEKYYVGNVFLKLARDAYGIYGGACFWCRTR